MVAALAGLVPLDAAGPWLPAAEPAVLGGPGQSLAGDQYGLGAIVITDAAGSTAPLRDELYELYLEYSRSRNGWAARTSWMCSARSSKGCLLRAAACWWQLAGLTDVVDAGHGVCSGPVRLPGRWQYRMILCARICSF
jgi:hypothetical protein